MDRPGFNRGLVGFIALAALLGFGLGWLQHLLSSRQPVTANDAPASNPAESTVTTTPTEEIYPLYTPLINDASAVTGSVAPNFTLPDSIDQPVSLTNFKGQVVLLNFWASWCQPCEEEIPVLQAAYDRHREEGFTVLAVNALFLDTRQDADAFMEKLNASLPVLYDGDGSVAEDLYAVIGLPTSVWIAPDGSLNAFHVGPLTTDDVEAKLAELLPAS